VPTLPALFATGGDGQAQVDGRERHEFHSCRLGLFENSALATGGHGSNLNPGKAKQ
jgi:hypothetical protein